MSYGIKFLRWISARLDRIASRLSPVSNSIQYERCLPWFRDNGDKTLRLNYDLNETSVVVDLGGYEGQWAADIFTRYACRILIFEPYPAYAENIRKRFLKNTKVRIFEFGLSDSDKSIPLAIASDSSSAYKKSQESVEVALRSASKFISDSELDTIDLMKINIEGGEYDLLDHLIEVGFVTRIQNIQVQFHDFVPDAERRMKSIHDRLLQTHSTTYQYPFVWENWRLKSK